MTVRHNAGYDLPAGTVTGQSHVSSYTLVDLSADIGLSSMIGLKDMVLSLSVQNLFDRDPPYYGALPASYALGGYANGGTLGRTIGLGIRTKF